MNILYLWADPSMQINDARLVNLSCITEISCLKQNVRLPERADWIPDGGESIDAHQDQSERSRKHIDTRRGVIGLTQHGPEHP